MTYPPNLGRRSRVSFFPTDNRSNLYPVYVCDGVEMFLAKSSCGTGDTHFHVLTSPASQS
nr:hypothetical protein [Sneathiella sp.]